MLSPIINKNICQHPANCRIPKNKNCCAWW